MSAVEDFDKLLEDALKETGEEMPSAEAKPCGDPCLVQPSSTQQSFTPEGQIIPNFERRGAHLAGVGGPGRDVIEKKAYDQDTDKLFNTREDVPSSFATSYRHEKPEHRIMAYLKAQGFSNKEISVRTGYGYASVCQILQLPWTKEVVREEIIKNGRNLCKEMLESSSVDNVQTLLQIRDNPNSRDVDKINAVKELFDRTWGKANQPITHIQHTDLNELSDQDLAKIIASGGRQN